MEQKNRLHKFIYVLMVLILGYGAQGRADDGKWQEQGINDSGAYILSIDRQSIKKTSDQEVYIKVRRELSAEGQKTLRKWFVEEKARAEKEAGAKMVGDEEEIFRLLVKNEAHEAYYFFYKNMPDYRMQELRQRGGLNLVKVYPLKKGSTEEKIKDIVWGALDK